MRIRLLLSLFLPFACNPLYAAVQHAKFVSGNSYLIVETLDNDLVHFEISASGAGPDAASPLYTSPMIHKTAYPGPSTYTRQGDVIETGEIRIAVDAQSLCVSLTYKIKQRPLTTICPQDLGSDWKGLSLARDQITHVYGLGQQFKMLGSADGDWLRHGVREEQPAGQEQAHGNGFMPLPGQAGMVGNVQFPVMYALGDDGLNYALLLDNVYKQRWDFGSDPWQVRTWGDQIRFYVMTGANLPDLRKDYMELVGTPPVPPRKAFGLWVSEFGYRNWDQVGKLRDSLRQTNFPLDGFVLDLQWFGGVKNGSPDSAMGRLDWDITNFPDPGSHIDALARDDIGLVAIEESYVSENTDTFAQMKGAGGLFAYGRNNNKCDPATQSPVMLSNWFGRAAMIDWSNPDAGMWVHGNRRLPNLSRNGVTAHWTDLGEPEKYDGDACYRGVEISATGPKNTHGDIHNLYAFLWNKSIYEGYRISRNLVDRRPFIVSRSGAPGSARWGVAMWSGDIGSNLDLLAAHMNSQMHMSLSGIDYYGSDIGGFRREGMPYNGGHSGNLQYQNELYTQWFANGAWFDVPVRPHTDNSFQTTLRYETAPNLVGDTRANRENIRQRYELIPYYYSLAYRAYLAGEPVVPPLVYYYQDDPNVRQIGHEKLIGRDLLVGVVAKHGEYARNIYLPKGKWANYHTRDWFDSAGQWVDNFPTYIDGTFKLPAFARAGAILPMMRADEQTKDVFGHRKSGSPQNDLMVQVYADTMPSQFVLYEDDGVTLDYGPDTRPVYRTRTTPISQRQTGKVATIVIDEAAGGYAGAATQRNNIVRLIVQDARAASVKLNGATLAQKNSAASFAAAASGWLNAGRNLVLIKSGVRGVAVKKNFKVTLQPVAGTATVNLVCDNGWTAPGDNIYAVGNQPALGDWNPEKGIKLDPSIYYEYIYSPPPGHSGPGPNTPKWSAVVQGLAANSNIEWKCAKKLASGLWQWQAGDNNTVAAPAPGFAGTSVGAF